MALISINEVEHSYLLGNTEVQALKGVSCEVEKGEMVALVGPSGSGKTTIINLIGTLDSPTKGEIKVGEYHLNQLTPKEKIKYRKSVVSFVFQFFNLFPTLNVFENVEFPLLFSDVEKAEIAKRVSEALTLVGLGELTHRKIDELSGGQRQRVAVARALVSQVPIVLADEPTANLDGKTARQVMELMVEINQKMNTTFLFSTHDPRIMEYATKRIILADGQIKEIQSN